MKVSIRPVPRVVQGPVDGVKFTETAWGLSRSDGANAGTEAEAPEGETRLNFPEPVTIGTGELLLVDVWAQVPQF